MPFWQNTTVAADFLTVSTIRRSMFSSSERNAWSWLGSVISIFASISVFLTSRATSISAIFAFSTCAGLLAREPVPARNDRRVDVLVDHVLRLLEQLSCQDHGGRRSVAGLLVLGLRDLDEHLRSRVLDVDLLQDRHAVVRDHDVPEGIHEHLVHPARAKGAPHRICNRLRGRDVVELRAFAPLPLRPFLQHENLCPSWHHR